MDDVCMDTQDMSGGENEELSMVEKKKCSRTASEIDADGVGQFR